jgi:hypothetical protein
VSNINLPPPTPEEAGEGTKALEEASALAVGADLSSREALNKVNELFREDKRDTHLYLVTVIGLWIIGVVFFLLFAVLAVHKVLPHQYRFLDTDDIKSLTEFLFSGFLGALVTKGGESLVKKNKVD